MHFVFFVSIDHFVHLTEIFRWSLSMLLFGVGELYIRLDRVDVLFCTWFGACSCEVRGFLFLLFSTVRHVHGNVQFMSTTGVGEFC
ncbi:hypothetical protein M758_10G074200 [Ceratodon purpureus]|uniref:Uncharacterized protein n=1 Tax=Ceratodon purpureus TaxID=3225 RepID=A0A8T0GKH2_CERPU|nr:hypothetical protein KC19_10G076300 [Ceratodon purpureus]KAG0603199.1 hypothetical protein M758_10G074200 [Ceratodon purpureus]